MNKIEEEARKTGVSPSLSFLAVAVAVGLLGLANQAGLVSQQANLSSVQDTIWESVDQDPCKVHTVMLLPPSDLLKAPCPQTQPAAVPGFDIEVEVDYWEVTGYAMGDSFTPGTNTSDGWQQGIRREVRPGITVACPEELELGTVVIIEHLGPRVCEDRGGAVYGKRLDVAFGSPAAALVWGKRWVRVAVIRAQEEEPKE